MILLDSDQILAAVRRSLEAHVLPKVDDNFARVQVSAALKAIDEVVARLTNGDPCEELNCAIAADAQELAASLRDRSPEFAGAVDEAVAGAPPGDDPRERNRQLVGALWPLASRPDDEDAARLLALLTQRGSEFADRDGAWLCPEALMSLM